MSVCEAMGKSTSVRVIVAAAALLAAACQPGSRGPLAPADGQQTARQPGTDDRGALLTSGGVVMVAAGSWSERLGSSVLDVVVTYENRGRAPAVVRADLFGASREADVGGVAEVLDVTDMYDPDTTPGEGRAVDLLLRPGGLRGRLTIPSGARRVVEVLVELDDAAPDLAPGQKVTVKTATPTDTIDVGFVTAG